jgi:hypothetical protein
MVRVAAVLAAAFVTYGCFSKPDAPNGQVVGDGGQTDDAEFADARGSGSGSEVAGCPYDMFDGAGAACGTWGATFGSGGGVSRVNSTLNVKPEMPSGNGVGCISQNAFDFSQGVSVDIQQFLDGAMTYTTFFEVQNGANTTQLVRVNITHTTGGEPSITTSCLGATIPNSLTVSYNIAQHRFFQFKPSATPNAVDIFARGDGGNFAPLQAPACTWSNAPTTVKVRIGAFSGADVGSTAAVFDSLSCP